MSDSDTSTSVQHFSKKMVGTRELIQLVRQKRCLWDRCHPSYRDRAEKDKCWHEIYLEFEPAYDTLNDSRKNLIGNTITRKWYNVRDSYVKSRKPGVRRPYVYSDDLQFLDPIYLNERKNLSEKTSFIEERISNDEEGDNDNTHSWLNEVFVDIEEGQDGENGQTECAPKRQKIDYNSSKEEGDENIVTVLANLIQKEEDEDRAFFKSITPSVKKLSESAKFEFRIQVMKLISSLKIRDRTVVKKVLKRERTSNVDTDSE